MQDRTDDVHANGFTDHVLVCTTERDPEYACCGNAGSEAVLEAVKTWLRDRDVFWSRIHVAETSCLGLCSEDGTAIAIHPRSRWYSDVTPADVPELLAAEFGEDASGVSRSGIERNEEGTEEKEKNGKEEKQEPAIEAVAEE